MNGTPSPMCAVVFYFRVVKFLFAILDLILEPVVLLSYYQSIFRLKKSVCWHKLISTNKCRLIPKAYTCVTLTVTLSMNVLFVKSLILKAPNDVHIVKMETMLSAYNTPSLTKWKRLAHPFMQLLKN